MFSGFIKGKTIKNIQWDNTNNSWLVIEFFAREHDGHVIEKSPGTLLQECVILATNLLYRFMSDAKLSHFKKLDALGGEGIVSVYRCLDRRVLPNRSSSSRSRLAASPGGHGAGEIHLWKNGG